MSMRTSIQADTVLSFFFFNDTATTEIYTLSLHDALPIYLVDRGAGVPAVYETPLVDPANPVATNTNSTFLSDSQNKDRKSTRLNSSHSQISYAVFCLKKKKRLSRAEPMSSTQSRPIARSI